MKNIFHLGLPLILFAVGIGGTLSSKWLEKKILYGQGKSQMIARAGKIDGQVERRPYDMLNWLSLDEKEGVRSGDYVRTKADSHVDLELLQKGSKVDLGPESLIRISMVGDLLILDLEQGEIQTLLSSTQKVEVHQIEAPPVAPNEKNEAPSGQHSTADSAPEKDKESKKEVISPEAVGNKQQEPLRAPEFKVYPVDASVLFFNRQTKKLRLSMSPKCESECHLRLVHGTETVASLSVQPGKDGAFELVLSPSLKGIYNWNFDDGDQKKTGHFEIYPFDAKLIQEKLQGGQNIEILH